MSLDAEVEIEEADMDVEIDANMEGQMEFWEEI